MSANKLMVCFDRIVPQEFAKIARQRAIAENPANGSPLEIGGVRSKLWKPGRTLKVKFLDGVPEVQQKVAQIAHQWSEHANITFDFGDHPDAEIRISFNESGSWSALGTDALVTEWFPSHVPTMNYGWLTTESTHEQYLRVVLHEFGHALGMIHEHQSPAGGILWNRDAVIKDLSGPPNNWDLETIEHNVFERYDAMQTQFTEFDPQSIMLYSFPKHWTLNGMEFPTNTQLSRYDQAFVNARYPR